MVNFVKSLSSRWDALPWEHRHLCWQANAPRVGRDAGAPREGACAGYPTDLPADCTSVLRTRVAAVIDPRALAAIASGLLLFDYILPAQNYSFTPLAGSYGSGSADGTGSIAKFSAPRGIALDSAGSVYVADSGNDTIRKITTTGIVTTLAGLPGVSGSADGTGGAARFDDPAALAVDTLGNVYVADCGNGTIRKITPRGEVTTLAGLAGSWFATDGTGSAARFNGPSGVAVDPARNVYVADYYNQTIRKITPGGLVATLAGLAGYPGSADGTGSAARFYRPTGVAVDGSGNVYVTDSGNQTVRKVTPAGVVTTLAGLAGSSGSTDGSGSGARFWWPAGITLDGFGNLYVADNYNSIVRRINPAGIVTTVAGIKSSSVSSDGVGSAARFWWPAGVAVDNSATVYVVDSGDGTVYRGIPTSPELHIARLGDQVILTWPSSNQRLTVETTEALGHTSWIPATPDPVTTAGQNVLTNPLAGSTRFYRLRKE